jgi:hypothetical protein
LGEQLASNQFRRPLYLESSQTAGDLKGEIYATFEHPYSTVNVKYSEASRAGGADTLTVLIGRKYDQPLRDAYRVDFDKMGFSIVERRANGEPVYIGNVRGVVERNTAPDGPSAGDDSGLGMAALRRTAAHIARRLHGQIAFPIAPRIAAVIPPNGTPCAGKPIDQAPSDSIHIVATIRTLALARDRLWLMSGKVGRCHETTLRPTASSRYHHIHYAWCFA